MSRALIACVLCLCLASTGRSAQPGLPIGAAVLGLVGRNIVEDARRAAASLINQAENSGNALLSRFGNQLNVAAENAALLAGSELDRQVRRMSDQSAYLMNNLQQMIGAVNSLRSDTYRLKDSFIVDIRSLTAGVPFVGERFYIQSISGIMQLQKDTDYRMSILAVGLGPESQRRRSRVALNIDGQTVANVQVDQTRANEAALTIPNGVLAPRFDPSKPVIVKNVKLEFEIQRKGRLRWGAPERYSIPVTLTLMPLNAGTITVTTTARQFDWVPQANADVKNTRTTDDLHDQGRYGHYELEIKVAGGHTPPVVGDKRFAGARPRFTCVAGQDACRFRDIFYVDFLDGKTTAKASWRTNSHATTWELSAPVEAYQRVADSKTTSEHPIQFGRNVLIRVPTDREVVHITGRTIGGETIDLVYPSGNELMSAIDHGASDTIVYFVARPAGVD